jgi:hypothetical protein
MDLIFQDQLLCTADALVVLRGIVARNDIDVDTTVFGVILQFLLFELSSVQLSCASVGPGTCVGSDDAYPEHSRLTCSTFFC